jgi:hypothetical protein
MGMSQETPTILYVGDPETGEWLASTLEPLGAYVYLSNELLPALGMFMTYEPGLVILDARALPELAQGVYFHLNSINAESILIFDQTASSNSDLLAAINDYMGLFVPMNV